MAQNIKSAEDGTGLREELGSMVTKLGGQSQRAHKAGLLN